MKKGYYSRTDITKKAINKAKMVIKNAKEENPTMTWQDRNILMSTIANLYKDDEFFQPIMFCDSVCKWWNKNYN